MQAAAEWLWLHRAFVDVHPAAGHALPIPRQPIGEGWLTRIITSLMGTRMDGQAIEGPSPNGMLWRQVWLLLVAVAYRGPLIRAHREGRGWRGLTPRRLALYLLLLTSFCIYVGLNRVVLGISTWFDLGITVGVSVYTFWILYALILRWRSPTERSRFLDVAGVSLVFLPVFFFLSGSKAYWVLGGVAIVTSLGLVDYAAGLFEGLSEERRGGDCG